MKVVISMAAYYVKLPKSVVTLVVNRVTLILASRTQKPFREGALKENCYFLYVLCLKNQVLACRLVTMLKLQKLRSLI